MMNLFLTLCFVPSSFSSYSLVIVPPKDKNHSNSQKYNEKQHTSEIRGFRNLEIILADHNYIRWLCPGYRNQLNYHAFPYEMTSLIHLDLSYNRLDSIPDLLCLPNLQHLNIKHNRVMIDSIINLDYGNSLQVLDLSENRLGWSPSMFIRDLKSHIRCCIALRRICFKGNPFLKELPNYYQFIIKIFTTNVDNDDDDYTNNSLLENNERELIDDIRKGYNQSGRVKRRQRRKIIRNEQKMNRRKRLTLRHSTSALNFVDDYQVTDALIFESQNIMLTEEQLCAPANRLGAYDGFSEESRYENSTSSNGGSDSTGNGTNMSEATYGSTESFSSNSSSGNTNINNNNGASLESDATTQAMNALWHVDNNEDYILLNQLGDMKPTLNDIRLMLVRCMNRPLYTRYGIHQIFLWINIMMIHVSTEDHYIFVEKLIPRHLFKAIKTINDGSLDITNNNNNIGSNNSGSTNNNSGSNTTSNHYDENSTSKEIDQIVLRYIKTNVDSILMNIHVLIERHVDMQVPLLQCVALLTKISLYNIGFYCLEFLNYLINSHDYIFKIQITIVLSHCVLPYITSRNDSKNRQISNRLLSELALLQREEGGFDDFLCKLVEPMKLWITDALRPLKIDSTISSILAEVCQLPKMASLCGQTITDVVVRKLSTVSKDHHNSVYLSLLIAVTGIATNNLDELSNSKTKEDDPYHMSRFFALHDVHRSCLLQLEYTLNHASSSWTPSINEEIKVLLNCLGALCHSPKVALQLINSQLHFLKIVFKITSKAIEFSTHVYPTTLAACYRLLLILLDLPASTYTDKDTVDEYAIHLQTQEDVHYAIREGLIGGMYTFFLFNLCFFFEILFLTVVNRNIS
jgi:hypothetical protein